MADWKDRATEVVPENHWTSRATPVGQPTQQAAEPSSLEAGLRGASQGVTLGLGDELAGAIQNPSGALKTATGLLPGTDDVDTKDSDVQEYMAARDAQRKANEAASNAHPWIYGGGELAGGVALPLGELSAAKNLTGLARAGALAGEGAALGGAAAVGGSNASTGQGLTGDVAKGAALGAVINPAMQQVIPETVSGIGDFLKTFKPIQESSEVVSRRLAGDPSLRGQPALQRETANLRDMVKNDFLPFAGDQSRAIKNSAYDTAFASKTNPDDVDISSLLNSARQSAIQKNLDPNEAQKVIGTIERFGQQQPQTVGFKAVNGQYANPEEASQQAFMDKLQGKRDVQVANLKSKLPEGAELPEGLDDNQISVAPGDAYGNNVANVSSPAKGLSDINALVPKNQGKGEFSKIEPIMQDVLQKPTQSLNNLTELKMQLDDYVGNPNISKSVQTYAKNLKNQVDGLIESQVNPDLYNNAKNMAKLESQAKGALNIADYDNQGSFAGDQAWTQNKTDEIAKKVKNIAGDKNPEQGLRFQEGLDALKQMEDNSGVQGPSKTEALQNQLQEQGRKTYLSGIMNKEGTPILGKNPISTLGSAKGILLSTADVAGGGMRSLLDSPPADLTRMAANLAKNGYDKYANVLQQANLAPSQKRRALLFTLSQTPDFRNALPEIFGVSDGTNK